MALQVSIIGPTNIGEMASFTGKTPEFLLGRAELVGRILAELGCDLFTNAGEGMLFGVAQAYLANGGTSWTVILSEEPVPWPNYHVLPYKDKASVTMWTKDWYRANHGTVEVPTVCICMGLSLGTFGEHVLAGWDIRFPRMNLKQLIVIQELLSDWYRGSLPPEIEHVLKPKLLYIPTAEEVREVLMRFLT
ncbi:MAG: hypothetical protein HYW97_01475 [Candidatus Wildermuthbacteria bacterium]|nr:hypothetical protein [Candidatus Wildermuthbacteria bacterium]